MDPRTAPVRLDPPQALATTATADPIDLLTQKIAEAPDAEAREALLESVAAGTAVSWHHINLLGEYDFSDE